MTQHPAIAAVGELIRTQTMRIHVTADVAYTVRAPCLLQQLADAIGVGLETGGRGVPASRPPIAVDAWDLWVEITHDAHAWARLLGVDAHRYIAPEPTGPRPVHGTPPAGKLLRAVAAVAATTRPLVADAITEHAQRWTRQVTAMLTGQTEQRGVRGAACHTCGATQVVDVRDPDAKPPAAGRYRVPAIVLIVELCAGMRMRWLACRACGWNTAVAGDSDVVHTSDTPDDPDELDEDCSQAA